MKNIFYILFVMLSFTSCKLDYELDCDVLDCENGVFIEDDCECECIKDYVGEFCDQIRDGCVSESDSMALVALYNSADGANWTRSWNLSSPVVTWHGVTLNDKCRVVSLDLYENNLDGAIPTEIGDLTELYYLSLGLNKLTGQIPLQLDGLMELTHLDLGWNNLAGQISPGLGNLVGLTKLHLGGNELIGQIPLELYNLIGLTYLHLGGNNLVGQIPNEIKELTLLNFLDLANNRLTGTIPEIINLLEELKCLFFDRNELNGPIPDMSQLVNLRMLDVSNNKLSGCYNSSICDFINSENFIEFNFKNNEGLPMGGANDFVNDYCKDPDNNSPCE